MSEEMVQFIKTKIARVELLVHDEQKHKLNECRFRSLRNEQHIH